MKITKKYLLVLPFTLFGIHSTYKPVQAINIFDFGMHTDSSQEIEKSAMWGGMWDLIFLLSNVHFKNPFLAAACLLSLHGQYEKFKNAQDIATYNKETGRAKESILGKILLLYIAAHIMLKAAGEMGPQLAHDLKLESKIPLTWTAGLIYLALMHYYHKKYKGDFAHFIADQKKKQTEVQAPLAVEAH